MQRSDTSTVKPIAVDEGEYLRWNADPFDLDGGSGASETDPGDARVTSGVPRPPDAFAARRRLTLPPVVAAGYFILPYWMAR